MWEDWWAVIVILAIVGIIIGVFVHNNKRNNERERWFIHECMKDHKEYECVAMWRAGDRNTTVVPMPIYIPR